MIKFPELNIASKLGMSESWPKFTEKASSFFSTMEPILKKVEPIWNRAMTTPVIQSAIDILPVAGTLFIADRYFSKIDKSSAKLGSENQKVNKQVNNRFLFGGACVLGILAASYKGCASAERLLPASLALTGYSITKGATRQGRLFAGCCGAYVGAAALK